MNPFFGYLLTWILLWGALKLLSYVPAVSSFLARKNVSLPPLSVSWSSPALAKRVRRWGSTRRPALLAWFRWARLAMVASGVVGLVVVAGAAARVLVDVGGSITFRGVSGADGVPSSSVSNITTGASSVSFTEVVDIFPRLQVALPGITIPLSTLPYLASTLLVAGLVHELGHALAAAAHGLPTDGIGLLASPALPAAFVSFPDPGLLRPSPRSKLTVLGAGVWHNLLLAAVAAVLGAALAVPMLPLPSATSGAAQAWGVTHVPHTPVPQLFTLLTQAWRPQSPSPQSPSPQSPPVWPLWSGGAVIESISPLVGPSYTSLAAALTPGLRVIRVDGTPLDRAGPGGWVDALAKGWGADAASLKDVSGVGVRGSALMPGTGRCVRRLTASTGAGGTQCCDGKVANFEPAPSTDPNASNADRDIAALGGAPVCVWHNSVSSGAGECAGAPAWHPLLPNTTVARLCGSPIGAAASKQPVQGELWCIPAPRVVLAAEAAAAAASSPLCETDKDCIPTAGTGDHEDCVCVHPLLFPLPAAGPNNPTGAGAGAGFDRERLVSLVLQPLPHHTIRQRVRALLSPAPAPAPAHTKSESVTKWMARAPALTSGLAPGVTALSEAGTAAVLAGYSPVNGGGGSSNETWVLLVPADPSLLAFGVTVTPPPPPVIAYAHEALSSALLMLALVVARLMWLPLLLLHALGLLSPAAAAAAAGAGADIAAAAAEWVWSAVCLWVPRGLSAWLSLLGLVSLSMGILNALPVSVSDGGRAAAALTGWARAGYLESEWVKRLVFDSDASDAPPLRKALSYGEPGGDEAVYRPVQSYEGDDADEDCYSYDDDAEGCDHTDCDQTSADEISIPLQPLLAVSQKVAFPSSRQHGPQDPSAPAMSLAPAPTQTGECRRNRRPARRGSGKLSRPARVFNSSPTEGCDGTSNDCSRVLSTNGAAGAVGGSGDGDASSAGQKVEFSAEEEEYALSWLLANPDPWALVHPQWLPKAWLSRSPGDQKVDSVPAAASPSWQRVSQCVWLLQWVTVGLLAVNVLGLLHRAWLSTAA